MGPKTHRFGSTKLIFTPLFFNRYSVPGIGEARGKNRGHQPPLHSHASPYQRVQTTSGTRAPVMHVHCVRGIPVRYFLSCVRSIQNRCEHRCNRTSVVDPQWFQRGSGSGPGIQFQIHCSSKGVGKKI
jgi:hypothetical protein